MPAGWLPASGLNGAREVLGKVAEAAQVSTIWLMAAEEAAEVVVGTVAPPAQAAVLRLRS